MPKRKRKKYSRPQKPFDKVRIEEENLLRDKYGLKNKKEIWKADAAIGRIRNLAKQLIVKPEEEKKAFVEKLKAKGFATESIAEVLALDKEDWLKRRLQTVVFSKKLARTPKQARQLVTHKQVSIGNQIVNIPSYQVSLEEEPNIKLNIVLKKPKNSKKDSEEKVKEVKSEEIRPVEEVVEKTEVKEQVPEHIENSSEEPIIDNNKNINEEIKENA